MMVRTLLAAMLAGSGGLAVAQPPMPADQAADMLLNAARKAYNEQQHAFARERFREFLQKYANNPQANAARYGLALALLDGPDRDPKAALEALTPIASDANFPDRPGVLYRIGECHRLGGLAELAEGIAKPNELPQRRNNAASRFTEAQKQFAAAAEAYSAKAGPMAERGSPDLEWAARARADQAEMELRLNKPKEAQATTAAFADPASPSARSKSRDLGLYYHGYAAYLLGDTDLAGRSLNRLTPFTDPVFGTHARYLVGKLLRREGQATEAGQQFAAVVAEHERLKTAAAEALKQPDQFKNRPDEKLRLERLVNGPPPEHVALASFELGVLQYEAGQFAEALAKFQDYAKLHPQSPLTPHALLRAGFCQAKLGQNPEATATLTPLVTNPATADQALYWLAQVQAATFDPAKPETRDAALKTAIATLRQAVQRAEQLQATDPDAKIRRAEALRELADTLLIAKQPRDAAAIYEQLLNEKVDPRIEELLERQAAAWQAGGDFPRADQVCDRFLKEHPQSPLKAAVLFHHAENAYLAAVTADQNPNTPNRPQAVPAAYEEAAKRYRTCAEAFPEAERVNRARYGVGLCLFRKQEFDKARAALEAIAAPDRVGDLARVNYLLAECLMREAPETADDALTAGKVEELLKQAAALLETFANVTPPPPEADDALLKLGYCQQRLASLRGDAKERGNAYGTARRTYELLIQKFPQSPSMPAATLERAKCIAASGDRGTAINELRRFTTDPLRATPVAPMAVVQLATYLREQNQAEEGAKLLGECRQRDEANLAREPARAGWVNVLKYHHGICLLETSKFAEARPLFEQVAQSGADRPEALEGALRAGQSRLLEGRKALEAAQARKATPGLSPPDLAAADQQIAQALQLVRQAGEYLSQQAAAFQAAQPTAEARGRLLYDAAWAWRLVGEMESADARLKLQQEQHKKLVDEAAKKTAAGAKPPVVPLPEVPLASVPVQPAEQQARAAYTALITGFPELPLAAEARFELAELHAQRAEHDAAIKLLGEAIDQEPSAELTERLRLRLGASLLAKGDAQAAFEQFDTVTANPQSPLAPAAHYRAGECLLALKDPAKAAARLAVFRDQGPFQNLPGVSDRALLCLGQALTQAKQHDPARQAYETLWSRFPNSPWTAEARYGAGWALQLQGRHDEAVNQYQAVVAATASELGAKAQLQIGLCRTEQKRYPEAVAALLIIPFTYDDAALASLAMLEAARALGENQQTEAAVKLLQKLVEQYPESESAAAARQRLEALQTKTGGGS